MKINYDEGSGNTQTSEDGNSIQIQIGFKGFWKVVLAVSISAFVWWLI